MYHFFFQELFSWSNAITTDLLYTLLNPLTTSSALRELTVAQLMLILLTDYAQSAHLQIVQSWVTMLSTSKIYCLENFILKQKIKNHFAVSSSAYRAKIISDITGKNPRRTSSTFRVSVICYNTVYV